MEDTFWFQIQDTVGASPIDIAKAYMGTRTSEVGLGSKSLLTKDERASPNGAEFALKQYIPSPLPKPSTCWPGAMSQDQRDYLTPRSERGRCGLRNFPRTPYSRTIFSKSKSKLTQLQGDGNRALNTPTPLQQSQTPIYEQNDSKTLPNAADGEVLNLQRKPPSHSVGTKPVSTAISVSKHGQRWTFGSENSIGFSFPVSAYTWVSSEPPTPSIMPSIPASDVYQPKEGYAVPSYSFGLNRSTSRLVFAFPSTSSAPTNDIASDLKFNFGSDKTTRICFSSIGKQAIC